MAINNKRLDDKLLISYRKCPFYLFDYSKHHEKLRLKEDNERYYKYTNYALWLTTMGLLETLAIVDESLMK